MPYKDPEVGRRKSRERYQKNREAILARLKADPNHLRRAMEWNAANPDKVLLGKRKLLCKKHGITLEIYNQTLQNQRGVCAICKQPETGRRSFNLCVDHDHRHCPGDTGCAQCFRGLLCSKCNFGIGHFRDDRYLLKQAIDYLTEKFPNVGVQTKIRGASA